MGCHFLLQGHLGARGKCKPWRFARGTPVRAAFVLCQEWPSGLAGRAWPASLRGSGAFCEGAGRIQKAGQGLSSTVAGGADRDLVEAMGLRVSLEGSFSGGCAFGSWSGPEDHGWGALGFLRHVPKAVVSISRESRLRV